MAATAFLFDLDGTIWDSYPCYAIALHSYLGLTHGEAVALLRSGGNAVIHARNCGLSNARFSRLCRDSLGDLRLYPETRETLQRLRLRGTPAGIVTNLPKWLVEPILSELNIRQYFDAVVYAARKPYPTGLIKAINDLSLNADDDVYYVGDMPTDAQAAAFAGVSFAWASYGYGDQCPPNTDAILSSFSDVLGL
jgi:phosphoglycolate phosphatase